MAIRTLANASQAKPRAMSRAETPRGMSFCFENSGFGMMPENRLMKKAKAATPITRAYSTGTVTSRTVQNPVSGSRQFRNWKVRSGTANSVNTAARMMAPLGDSEAAFSLFITYSPRGLKDAMRLVYKIIRNIILHLKGTVNKRTGLPNQGSLSSFLSEMYVVTVLRQRRR